MFDAIHNSIEEARLRRTLPNPETCRLLRLRAGVPQHAVAEAIGVRQTTVSRWERGRRHPRGEQLRGYLEALDLLAREGREVT